MSPPPRRLTFAVSTSLLTASLATGVVGCEKNGPNVNVAEPVHTNEGPEPEPDETDPDETVNVAPEADDGGEAEPGDEVEEHVNEGPEPDPAE